jgi:hypothetical protein
MQDGLEVYDTLFGEAKMVKRRFKGCPKGWKIFSMVDVEKTIKAHVAVREEWCVRDTVADWLVDKAARIVGM